MKFQFHQLHLEQYFIQERPYIKIYKIYVRITVSLRQSVYIHWDGKISSIKCLQILITTTFQLNFITKKDFRESTWNPLMNLHVD